MPLVAGRPGRQGYQAYGGGDNQAEDTDALHTAETNQELTAALDQLSLNQRRVVLLRYFGDLSFEQIAAELECPLGTALSHCRRGLAAMRKLLTVNEK